MTTLAAPEKPKVTLSSISRGATALPFRIMTYGVDGIGKSSFWAQDPGAIFVCTESGATRIEVP